MRRQQSMLCRARDDAASLTSQHVPRLLLCPARLLMSKEPCVQRRKTPVPLAPIALLGPPAAAGVTGLLVPGERLSVAEPRLQESRSCQPCALPE